MQDQSEPKFPLEKNLLSNGETRTLPIKPAHWTTSSFHKLWNAPLQGTPECPSTIELLHSLGPPISEQFPNSFTTILNNLIPTSSNDPRFSCSIIIPDSYPSKPDFLASQEMLNQPRFFEGLINSRDELNLGIFISHKEHLEKRDGFPTMNILTLEQFPPFGGDSYIFLTHKRGLCQEGML